jgi:hypothetical protein
MAGVDRLLVGGPGAVDVAGHVEQDAEVGGRAGRDVRMAGVDRLLVGGPGAVDVAGHVEQDAEPEGGRRRLVRMARVDRLPVGGPGAFQVARLLAAGTESHRAEPGGIGARRGRGGRAPDQRRGVRLAGISARLPSLLPRFPHASFLEVGRRPFGSDPVRHGRGRSRSGTKRVSCHADLGSELF